MSAADSDDRSLSGITIPKWIRSGRTMDLDQNAFSPPERDDTFLHIKFPPRTPIEQQNIQRTATLTSLTARLEGSRPRRGSKSLPASPLASPGGSPKARRRIDKLLANEGPQPGWILAGLLDSMSRSVSTITEGGLGEDGSKEISIAGTAAAAIANSGSMAINQQPQQIFKPKPSELREMNFWSPTSM